MFLPSDTQKKSILQKSTYTHTHTHTTQQAAAATLEAPSFRFHTQHSTFIFLGLNSPFANERTKRARGDKAANEKEGENGEEEKVFHGKRRKAKPKHGGNKLIQDEFIRIENFPAALYCVKRNFPFSHTHALPFKRLVIFMLFLAFPTATTIHHTHTKSTFL